MNLGDLAIGAIVEKSELLFISSENMSELYES